MVLAAPAHDASTLELVSTGRMFSADFEVTNNKPVAQTTGFDRADFGADYGIAFSSRSASRQPAL